MESLGEQMYTLYLVLCVLGPTVLALALLVLLISRNIENRTTDTRDTGTPLPAASPASALTQNIRFKNIVLYSGYNTATTEVDEIIVSPYGIFCIEYKAWRGVVFGSKGDKYWTQCKFNERVRRYSPVRQNYKHVKALEVLFDSQLRVPIHSLVVFTDATEVKTDYKLVLSGINELNSLLARHTNRVYTIEEWGEFCSILTYVSDRSGERMPSHIRDLQRYLAVE